MADSLLLGAIADDYTGGSDMAGMLASQGVRTLQTFGQPEAATLEVAREFDAVVVSLKTRSIAADAAVAQSLRALEWLRAAGMRQVQFKYCSTFDSTAAGNIGPVTDALMTATGAAYTVAVPALPVNGRTQYMGYLFVNGVPLSESPMRHHPLNPMTESNLVRHLQVQTSRRVGLVRLPDVRRGAAVRDDCEIALVDAVEDADLAAIARAVVDLPLITGGSGIAHALPAVWRETGRWAPRAAEMRPAHAISGRTLLIAGSCSSMTLAQIDAWPGAKERMRVEAVSAAEVERLAAVCATAWSRGDAVLVYSSAVPGERVASASEGIEHAFAALARTLRPHYSQIVVAGGETSGAVVEALGVRAVEIGAEIDPGVPVLHEISGPGLRLALKSGNFGAVDFFSKAVRHLQT
jgi:3-dehydrotetronate 4-kinase